MKTWLLDTGPLVAYLDSTDTYHSAVVSSLDPFKGSLATTSAVITEAMYFVSNTVQGPKLLAELVAGSGMQVYDFSQPPELQEAARLMER